jgi:glycosyltransferase involved in cell wall biosynthesis
MAKPNLTIFLQNKVGGLQFYYATLVQAGAFDDFNVRYIALDPLGDTDTRLGAALGGAPMEIFAFGRRENLYHMYRRLAGRLPRGPGIIVTNHHMELSCLDVFRPSDQTVVHVCHDEAYVGIGPCFAHVVDIFIAHNPYFAERLKKALSADRSKDVKFLPFGIRQEGTLQRTANLDRPLKIVFIGRLHEKKGVLDLPLIDDHLREAGVQVEWSLLGCGPEQERLEQAIAGRGNFKIESPIDTPALLQRAALGDVFVLPTRLDGTPLALMEALSVGLVPVVSEFNPGAHWMVPPEVGFVCPLEPKEFARIVVRLHADRSELESRSHAARNHADKEFNIATKKLEYARAFAEFCGFKAPSSTLRLKHGGFLDRPWIPNLLTRSVRRWTRKSPG